MTPKARNETPSVLFDETDDYPKSLADSDVLSRRKQAFDRTHMTQLNAFVQELRKQDRGEVPDFDPFDGGGEAQVLFLLEKPGPKTSEKGGESGFISRNNNDDETAAAIWRFMGRAGIPRELTVTWNVMPWWNGTIKYNADERKRGVLHLMSHYCKD